MTGKPEIASAPPDLTLVRTLAAPRELVWTVWTDPAHAAHWYGPHGFTTPVYEVDLRPGGRLRVHMRAPDGTIYPSDGTIEEVVPPERLVTFGHVEIDGSIAFAARTTVTFAPDGASTIVTVRQSYSQIAPAALPALDGAHQGWSEQFDKLEVYLRDRVR